MSAKLKIVISIYAHPEGYPPTLYAIEELSKKFDEVYVLHRPNLMQQWDYGENIFLISSGKFVDAKSQEKSHSLKKIYWFIHFTFSLGYLILFKRPKVVLLYDIIPLFSIYLMRFLVNKKIVWFHSHDLVEPGKIRKYSLNWFAAKVQLKMFERINIFSLPSLERKDFFPLSKFKGKVFVTPNFPSKKIFIKPNLNLNQELPLKIIKIIYQGVVCEGHGLEAIASLIGAKASKIEMQLHIVGNYDEAYKKEILEKSQYSENVFFYGRKPYKDIFEITRTCHVGLATLDPLNPNYELAATASNKIYEYPACGLPILYSESIHYKKYLGKYKWAFSVNTNQVTSLAEAIEDISINFKYLSLQARDDFEAKLNYHESSSYLLEYLRDCLKKSDQTTEYH